MTVSHMPSPLALSLLRVAKVSNTHVCVCAASPLDMDYDAKTHTHIAYTRIHTLMHIAVDGPLLSQNALVFFGMGWILVRGRAVYTPLFVLCCCVLS